MLECSSFLVLEKILESPLDFKEIQPAHTKGDQSWVFFGRNDAEAETPVLWPPHATSWLIGKDSDAGRDWGQEEKGTTEDEMAGWHYGLDGREFEWTPGDGDGQGGLACCDSWGRKESDMTEQLNWTDSSFLMCLLNLCSNEVQASVHLCLAVFIGFTLIGYFGWLSRVPCCTRWALWMICFCIIRVCMLTPTFLLVPHPPVFLYQYG